MNTWWGFLFTSLTEIIFIIYFDNLKNRMYDGENVKLGMFKIQNR